MNTALLIGSLGLALAAIGPAIKRRKSARESEREYFAAARRRAITYRLAAKERAKSADKQ
jgi:hypothetical protein